MHAEQLLDLLLKKHSKDLCVPECKTGPTHYATPRVQKIDLWVMRKSWANPSTFAYEIKVSRNDFLRDEKWRGYLDYCTNFYFCCAPGVIQVDETPSEAGLLVASKNAKRLFTKKKAPSRDIEIPESIFRYLLMWRTTIQAEWQHVDNVHYWENWLQEKDEKKRLGHGVSYKIQQLLKQRVDKVKEKQRILEKENEHLNDIKTMIEQLGFDPQEIHRWGFENKFERKLEEIQTGMPEGLVRYLEAAIKELTAAHKVLLGPR